MPPPSGSEGRRSRKPSEADDSTLKIQAHVYHILKFSLPQRKNCISVTKINRSMLSSETSPFILRIIWKL
jgi:hypothetical protein